MDNYEATILRQYANSPKLLSLIGSFNIAIDTGDDFDSIYDMYFNLQTAVGYGLDCWGKIVGVSRYMPMTANTAFFGFDEAYLPDKLVTNPQPFDTYTFNTGVTRNSRYSLPDESYRKLIFVKAMSNISDCTAKNINALLNYLFSESGECHVQDNLDMTMTFVFNWKLSDFEYSILSNTDYVPRPAGVGVLIQQVSS